MLLQAMQVLLHAFLPLQLSSAESRQQTSSIAAGMPKPPIHTSRVPCGALHFRQHMIKQVLGQAGFSRSVSSNVGLQAPMAKL